MEIDCTVAALLSVSVTRTEWGEQLTGFRRDLRESVAGDVAVECRRVSASHKTVFKSPASVSREERRRQCASDEDDDEYKQYTHIHIHSEDASVRMQVTVTLACDSELVHVPVLLVPPLPGKRVPRQHKQRANSSLPDARNARSPSPITHSATFCERGM